MKPPLSKSLRNNFRFLIVEVGAQVSSLQHYIGDSGDSSAAAILDRGGYTFNLKLRIHNDCYHQMLKNGNNEYESSFFRAIDTIAHQLERISELCCDCTHHVADLNSRKSLCATEYVQLLDRAALGISLIERALFDYDTQLAVKIGESQRTIGSHCQQLIDNCGEVLKINKQADDLISVLFVLKSIKHIGDALLKISEAILSASLGQAITIDRYHSLSDFVDRLQKDKQNKKLTVETIAETRSGSAISGISETDNDDIIAIFKDGKKQKLKEEQKSVENWHEIYPGIAPKILSYRKQGRSASLLIEHLQGMTFENILLQGSDQLQKKALAQLTDTLQDIWLKTLRSQPFNAQYMLQLQKRLNDVYALHPSFQQPPCNIAGLKLPAFNKLLKRGQKLESQMPAPFSVFIHGDFNTDNIIYDPLENKINFIDLHRSRYMDYVQDISVFMVSNYRLHALDQYHRRRVQLVNLAMYRFAADFAKQQRDETFEHRLALGLARSLATSTRFTLDKALSKSMFYRSRYLIEQVLQCKSSSDFRVPIKEIFIG